jgi:hypothetical protein
VIRSASVQIPVVVLALFASLPSPKLLWGPAAVVFTVTSEITLGFTQLHVGSVFMVLFSGVKAAGARR